MCGDIESSRSHLNSRANLLEQEVIMEIMDKYVLAGEALAEKENDVRQLRKEVRYR